MKKQNKNRMNRSFRAFGMICAAVAALIAAALLFSPAVNASGDLDEILNYEVTVDVNEDATLRIRYHIDWKVLDSTSDGPLSWVKVGIPNDHYTALNALSSTIQNISYTGSGGSYARIDLDRNYYKDEVASFDFEVITDYMYEMNLRTEGETEYQFTPGWFSDLNVDKLTLRWNSDKLKSWSPACVTEDGYNVWVKENLGHGEQFTVQTVYPNDAFAFDESKFIDFGGEETYRQSSGNILASILGGVCCFSFGVLFIGGIILSIIQKYKGSSGFTAATQKKITRTKVEYYPICEGCGAPRPEGKETCEACGRSFIKSEEILEEKDIPAEESELKNKTESGLFGFSSSPNTFMRVNVVNVPVVHRSGFFSSLASGLSGSGSSHSSGRSSSCAHSSCACACACACAGGGRAGCSVKDFYNTDLKLKQLEKKCVK